MAISIFNPEQTGSINSRFSSFNETGGLGGASGGSAAKGAGGAGVAAGVMSGLTDIATGIINVGRMKNQYKFNAGMIELQKRLARLSSEIEIKNIRKQARSLLSSQRAGYAKAGMALSGTPLLVMLESQKEAELDVIYSRINADLGISALSSEQAIQKMSYKSKAYDEYMGMGKTILNMGTKYYQRG